MTFIWDETNAGQGSLFDIYTARSDGGVMTVEVYCSDGYVSYVTSKASIISSTSDTNAANQFGVLLGSTISMISMSMLIGEEGVAVLSNGIETRFAQDLSATERNNPGYT